MIRHHVNKVLDLSTLNKLSIGGTKLETIRSRTKVELARRDNLVASSNTGIKLLIGGCRSIVLVNRSSGVNRPVDIQTSQQTVCHIFIWLTIVLTIWLLWQLVSNIKKFLLYPPCYVCTRLAVRKTRTMLCRISLVINWSITEVIHFEICEISTHSPCSSNILWVSI